MQTEGHIEDIYTLSPMQEGILFHALMAENTFTYFEQMSFRLNGTLDIPLFKKSLNMLFQRHGVLRTAFIYENTRRPVQVVLKKREAGFLYEDRPKTTAKEEKEQWVEAFKAKDKQRSFDLTRDPLLRVAVLQLEEKEYEVVWSFHHILMDGWSTGILISEFFEVYNSLLENRDPRLAKAIPYRIYIRWLEKQDKEKSKNYWKNYLDGYGEKTVIPGQKTFKNRENGYENQRFSISLDPVKINQLAAGNQVSTNTFIQTLWGTLLAAYNRKRDVVFGAVVSGRPPHIEGGEAMVGLFINTIPVRIFYDEKTTFNRLLKHVQQRAVDSEPYHYYPLADIQAESLLKQDLIDHILVFENYPIADRVEGIVADSHKADRGPGFGVTHVDVFEQTNYDFGLRIIPGEPLTIEFNYNGSAYDREFIERAAGHFNRLIHQVLNNQEIDIHRLSLLSESEKKLLLEDFNQTSREYPGDKTLPLLFKEQADQTPDRIALVGLPHHLAYRTYRTHLSYKTLNEKSRSLAGLLGEKGVKPDTIVGIMSGRSIEMIVGIMGILKAGGAYLPIDPDYPEERKKYMLADSGTKILLTNLPEGRHFNCQLSIANCQLSMIGEAQPATRNSQPAASLAYVIYTSGTTGRPKGVPVEHRNVVNTLLYRKEEYEMDTNVITLQLFSYAFDGFVTDFFTPVLAGGKVVLLDEKEKKDVNRIKTAIVKNSVTHLLSTPALYQAIIESLTREEAASLKVVSLAGDRLSPFLLEATKRKNSRLEVSHEYGVTEAAVMSTLYRHQQKDNQVKIGFPTANTVIYILDQQQRPQPIGVPGELCIGGAGVAKGYLNQPELTAEKFPPMGGPTHLTHPLTYSPSYKTGDLAQWLPDGSIQFLGRIDQQVKIRGFRVEPGEIENQLSNHEEIEEAVVLSKEREDGDTYLCAYIASKNGGSLPAARLREYLLKHVPDYMVPSYFVMLPRIPLTPNGKVDRRALPAPGIEAGDGFIAPRNQVEEKLVEIWAETLGIEKKVIGIDANFFQMGGHSLKATVVAAKIHKELQVKLPLAEVFETPTIRGLSAAVTGVEENEFLSIEWSEKKEYYNLSSIQKRMYIAQQMEIDSTSYNMPEVMVLKGSLDRERLKETFEQLINRHESLRTSFIMLEDGPVQKIHQNVPFEIENHDPFIRPFDLSQPPLLRVGLKKTGEAEHLLMVDMHHIITDAASRGILENDFTALYNGNHLPPLNLQYKDFSEWLNRLVRSGEIDKQEGYWLNKFKGDIPVLNMPTDYRRPSKRRIDEGDSIEFLLENPLSIKVFDIMKKTGTTLYMVLSAVYNIFLYKYTGDEDIVVGTPVGGRRHADLLHVIGVFLNMLAMRNRPQGDKTFLEFLEEVKKNALEAYENQDYQFEELVKALRLQGDAARNPLFDTEFTAIKIEPQTQPAKETGIHGLFIEPRPDEHKFAKFDLHFQATEAENTIHMMVRYSKQLFKESTIQKIKGYYIEILQQVAANMDIKLRDITVSHRRLTVKPNLRQDDSSNFIL